MAASELAQQFANLASADLHLVHDAETRLNAFFSSQEGQKLVINDEVNIGIHLIDTRAKFIPFQLRPIIVQGLRHHDESIRRFTIAQLAKVLTTDAGISYLVRTSFF